MIVVKTIEEDDFDAMKTSGIRLKSLDEIESTFEQMLSMCRDVFSDEWSLKLIWDLDHIKRTDFYGNRKPLGRNTMMHLSWECKLGLILLFSSDVERINTLIDKDMVGTRVWYWLERNVSMRIYVAESEYDLLEKAL